MSNNEGFEWFWVCFWFALICTLFGTWVFYSLPGNGG